MDRQVRRSRGIYYTPDYVVDYIVRSTLGKHVEGKSPALLAGRRGRPPFRVLDPACGSGAFLLGAFRFLLDFCLHWYRGNHPQSYPKAVERDPGTGQWRLRLAEKKRILSAHVFGVDIDPGAVEAARACLGREIQHGYMVNRTCRKMGAMPTLAGNIKCGNALLGPENFVRPGSGRTAEFMPRNGFDWNAEFPAVMKSGGFDCILGNPPYRRELHGKHLMDEITRTPWGRKYHVPRMDLWYYFLHRGLELLQPAGVLSYIVSAYWTAGAGAEKLIAALRDSTHVDEIFHLGTLPIFPKVSEQHLILRVTKMPSCGAGVPPALKKYRRYACSTTIKWADVEPRQTAEAFLTGKTAPKVFRKTARQLFRDGRIDLLPPADSLLAKLQRWKPLGELGDVRQGIAENPAAINRKTSRKHGNR